MSASGLTSEAQLRYLLQWFEEFSELQREDFLPILAAARGGKPDQLAASMAALSYQDKPVSLFQCRIKLFNEWYPTWAEEEQDRLVKGVSEIDIDFGTKLQDILTNGPKLNGFDDVYYLNDVEDNAARNDEVQSNGDHDAEENNREDQVVAHDNIPVEIVAAS